MLLETGKIAASAAKGLDKISKELKAENIRQKKAFETAIKVEGYRLMRQLKKEIRQGSPGGRKFKPLSYLARSWGGAGRLRADKPLSRLALAIRYVVKNNPFSMTVGFTGPKISKSWTRIAEKQQEGFTFDMPSARRLSFIRAAANMSKRSKARKYLFIRKEITRFTVPPRPIIEPFWDREKRVSVRNIRSNYIKKLKGQRI
jgi:hypothetical protein